MTFQIHALHQDEFAPLFDLSDEDLSRRNARRQVVREHPGTPCRVSMQDAQIGDTVLLLNYQHLPARSPYRATHAIFVREGVRQARIAPGEIPDVLARRLISLRLFDADHMMIDADVVQGRDLGSALRAGFADKGTAYIHLHNAKPGCFAAKVTRAL